MKKWVNWLNLMFNTHAHNKKIKYDLCIYIRLDGIKWVSGRSVNCAHKLEAQNLLLCDQPGIFTN